MFAQDLDRAREIEGGARFIVQLLAQVAARAERLGIADLGGRKKPLVDVEGATDGLLRCVELAPVHVPIAEQGVVGPQCLGKPWSCVVSNFKLVRSENKRRAVG